MIPVKHTVPNRFVYEIQKVVSIDSETMLIADGFKAPTPICWSYCDGENSGIMTHEHFVPVLESLLLDDTCLITGFNMAFDSQVICEHTHLTKAVFSAYTKGRILCTKVNEMLIDIALGTFTTKEKGRYSLEKVVKRRLGIDLSEQKGSSNSAFKDSAFLNSLGVYQRVKLYLEGRCTAKQIAKHLIPEFYFSKTWLNRELKYIESLAKLRYFEFPWRYRYADLFGMSVSEYPEEALKYSLSDTVEDRACYVNQINQASKMLFYGEPYTDGYYRVRNAGKQSFSDFCLGLASSWGFVTDLESVKKLKKPLEDELHKLNTSLSTIGVLQKNTEGDYSVNTKVLMSLVEKAYSESGREVKRTKTGLVQIDADTILETDDPLLVGTFDPEKNDYTGGYISRAYISDLLSDWVPTLEKGTYSPVHTHFNVLVNTGRTSSYKFNSQNPPRRGGVRECFIARPGYYMCSCDYSAIELRTLAQICVWLFGLTNCKLARTLIEGIDPHSVTGAMLLNCSLEEFLNGLKNDKKIKKSGSSAPTVFSDARSLAKALNFGLPGGSGAEAFVLYAKEGYGVILARTASGKMDFEKSIKLAKTYKNRWMLLYPEVEAYMGVVKRLCGNFGSSGTIRQFVSDRVRGDVTFTAGCNTGFQGLAADGMKDATQEIQRECYTGYTINDELSILKGSRLLTMVHDETIVEIPRWKAHECANRISNIQCEVMSRYCPDIPIIAEPAMSDRWYKDMEPVIVNGRLEPWYPENRK